MHGCERKWPVRQWEGCKEIGHRPFVHPWGNVAIISDEPVVFSLPWSFSKAFNISCTDGVCMYKYKYTHESNTHRVNYFPDSFSWVCCVNIECASYTSSLPAQTWQAGAPANLLQDPTAGEIWVQTVQNISTLRVLVSRQLNCLKNSHFVRAENIS